MSKIKLNQEMISALQKCKDAKAIMSLAKSKGVEISEEEAGKIFDALQNEELTDEELEKVVGGMKIFITSPKILDKIIRIIERIRH